MIRFCFYFTLSFFILSFPMGEKKLFYYIDTVTSPILAPTYKKVSTVSKEKFYDLKIWAMGIIGSSKTAAIDNVSTSYAAPVRDTVPDKDEKIAQRIKESSGDLLDRKSEIEQDEFYSDEEMKQLEAMLREQN